MAARILSVKALLHWEKFAMSNQPKWQLAVFKAPDPRVTLWVKLPARMITCYHVNGETSTMLRHETNGWAKNGGGFCTVIPERIEYIEEYGYDDDPPEIKLVMGS